MDNNYDNKFELAPGSKNGELSGEQVERAAAWESSMSSGVPEFTGEQFGVANEKNEYYGEAKDDDAEYNDGLANAAVLINYGLNAVAREKGVEAAVQGIKSFDASGSDNPIRDLYVHLGVDNASEKKDIREEAVAAKPTETSFKDETGMPKTEKRSLEGAFKAIEDMKELIAEVEGADPRYEELREGARAAGMGYFDFAVNSYGVRGLTELFEVLNKQKEKAEEESKETEEESEKEEKEPESGELTKEMIEK